uniref:ShKT domain-containing protein n=1 Tax=Rhabditophanes sp. KR3021 TaxID=114890 RepID=A0AC35UDL4_9BILA
MFIPTQAYTNYFHDQAACTDILKDCNTWINLCNLNPPFPLMDNCKKTCNKCPPPCNDVASNCAILNLCDDALYKPLMIKNCKKFCNFCSLPDPATVKPSPTKGALQTIPCVDQVGGYGPNSCKGMASYCNNPSYQPLMKRECAKTCGYC